MPQKNKSKKKDFTELKSVYILIIINNMSVVLTERILFIYLISVYMKFLLSFLYYFFLSSLSIDLQIAINLFYNFCEVKLWKQ